jgi:hypothetical protein
MAIPAKQIGWSQKSNLLWQISKQLEILTGVLYRSTSSTTTTTSTTTATPTTTTTTSSSSTTTTTSTSTSSTTTTTSSTSTTTSTTTATPTTTTTTTAFSYAIGSPYEGGVIAYVLQPGDPGYDAGVTHGLIAATSDQSAGTDWGCYGTLLPGASSYAIGTGNQNTIDIMAGCPTAGIAARLCGDLVLGGYSDWYLPSIFELEKLYINRIAIGGFATNTYWSSSQVNSTLATLQDFVNGINTSLPKNSTAFNVRAIRSF